MVKWLQPPQNKQVIEREESIGDNIINLCMKYTESSSNNKKEKRESVTEIKVDVFNFKLKGIVSL